MDQVGSAILHAEFRVQSALRPASFRFDARRVLSSSFSLMDLMHLGSLIMDSRRHSNPNPFSLSLTTNTIGGNR
jgi:hypothetical protein